MKSLDKSQPAAIARDRVFGGPVTGDMQSFIVAFQIDRKKLPMVCLGLSARSLQKYPIRIFSKLWTMSTAGYPSRCLASVGRHQEDALISGPQRACEPASSNAFEDHFGAIRRNDRVNVVSRGR